MSQETSPLHDEDLRQLLASARLRVTKQRMVLLRALVQLRHPTSHAELTERLSGGGLDRATVYRNLLSLTKAGLLVRTHLGDSVWRFELPRTVSSKHANHPHFICTDCGLVTCLSAKSVTLRGDATRNKIAEIQLRGVCAECIPR